MAEQQVFNLKDGANVFFNKLVPGSLSSIHNGQLVPFQPEYQLIKNKKLQLKMAEQHVFNLNDGAIVFSSPQSAKNLFPV